MKNFFIIIVLAMTAKLEFGQPYQNEMPRWRDQSSQNSTWGLQAALSQKIENSHEGLSLSLSSDGNTLAVGSYGSGTQIYARNGTTWSLQATLSQNVDNSFEGISVSLSADGNTLAAGSYGYIGASFTGGVQIYVRSGTTWTHQATLTQGVVNSSEGWCVALSNDGTLLAAGAPDYSNSAGATQIYTRSGNTWSHQTTLSQGIANSSEGLSVSLSADGTILATGAPALNNSTGATYVYVNSGTSWSCQATLTQKIPDSVEGVSVSLSADGSVLAVGAPDIVHNFNSTGSTQIYQLSGTTWTHQTTLTENVEGSNEGLSVSLSADGKTLAAGAPYYNDDFSGATQIYINLQSGWAHQTTLSQKVAWAYEGTSIDMSADTSTIAIGAQYINSTGGTFVYVN